MLGSALSCIGGLAQKGHINPENHIHIIKKLRNIVNDDSDYSHRGLAAYSLGKINDPVFIEMLPNLLNDKNHTVNTSAVDFMGESNNRKYTPLLTRALRNEEDKKIISRIVSALEKLEKQRRNSKNISPR